MKKVKCLFGVFGDVWFLEKKVKVIGFGVWR